METQIKTEFSERYEQIKSRFNLRNRDLARICGVSDNAITKVLQGVTESPDVRTLIALGRKLNLNADWLIYGEGPMVKEEEGAPDGSLKRGLQIRDELIAQLQKELWGKFEGAIYRPLSDEEVEYQTRMQNYVRSVFDQPFMQSIFLR